MSTNLSRRSLLQTAGFLALSPASSLISKPRDWSPGANSTQPKLCLGISPKADEQNMLKFRQIGVEHVLMGGPRIPWRESELQARMDRFQAGGLAIVNMMIGGFADTIYGLAGRDEEIDKVCQSIVAAGRVGLPVIEYNFYAHRLTEGYYEQKGRGGAGLTAYDYDRTKDLPPLPEKGAYMSEELWSNLTYFLKAVVPVAEQSGVRLALHPNDPPVPVSRGSEQIMATLKDWKRLLEIVPSPSNGITYDCGVTRELGEDPVEVCRYFGEKDRINHVHYRNVQVRQPYVNYTEVFPDEGQVNMFDVMKELVRQKYSFALYPEHPRALDADRELPGFNPSYPGGGGYAGLVYNVAYARAMLQAALSN